MKKLFLFFFSKPFWISIGLMICTIFIGIFAVSYFFNSYTRHDQFVEVPDFTGFHYSEVEAYISDKDLRYTISDSVFHSDQPRGVVLEQQPSPGEEVKPNRKIYLTINSVIPPSVALPELRDYTVRQVVNKIPTYGLKIDTIIYRPAECDNCVIGVLYDGKEIMTGTQIEKGKSISLIVGEGIGSKRIAVPYLYLLNVEEAKEKIISQGFNIGFVDFDTTIHNLEDSIQAFVYSQTPKFDSNLMIRQGAAIDLILTLDSNNLRNIQLLEPDTNSTPNHEVN